MKASDFDKVNNLITRRAKLIQATSQVLSFSSHAKETDGYWCALSEHKDGSGELVDLTGCMVAIEMADATLEVINDKLVATDAELKELGVEPNL